MKGTIEHLSEEAKGYGFIKLEDYEKKVFFHAKDLKGVSFNELRKGDAVIADGVEDGPKGQAAYGVSLA